MFSGYWYPHDPPPLGYAIVTNYQDFQTKRDDPEAWNRFKVTFWKERRPYAGELALVQRIGSWRAMTPQDLAELRELVQARKPREAIAGKAVDLVREMADQPVAQNTIGKQVSVIYLPSRPDEPPESGYHSAVTGFIDYMADEVIALGEKDTTAFRDFKMRKLDDTGDPRLLVIPKVGRNQPCPCGSRKKYKYCHGRPPVRRFEIEIAVVAGERREVIKDHDR